MKKTREIALDYIKGLNEKELVEFFYVAIESFNEDKKFPDGFERNRYCLAITNFGEFRNKVDEQYHVEFAGLPDLENAKEKHIQQRTMLPESGGCDLCSATVVCVAKIAICPICDSRVECT